jgi:hypothetical protein
LANTTHGIAKLHDAGRLKATDGRVDAALAALETAAVEVAPDMKPEEMTNTVYAYGTMKRMPGDDTWAALEATAVRMTPGMKAQEAANLTWAYATLGRMPGDKTWAALDMAVIPGTPDMRPQEVASLHLGVRDQDAPHQKDGCTETAASTNDAWAAPAKTDALGRPRSAAS